MQSMLITAIFPLIEFLFAYSLISLKRIWNRGFSTNTFITSCPTVQAYIDLYAGPAYLIHWRYSAILLNISVAFCYGTCMPFLYIIAVLAFAILYINERILLCYFYRKPPALSEKMTLLTMEIIKYIPYIMLPFAFWQLGNR